MRLLVLPFVALFLSLHLAAQDPISWRHRGPIWFSPAKNTQIHGISAGLFHFSFDPQRPTRTNGISIELGLGLLAAGLSEPYVTASPQRVAQYDTAPCLNRINGLSLSLLGETVAGEVRGLSLSGTMGLLFRVRGVQFAPLWCVNWEAYGLSLGFFGNHAYRVRGAQIGGLSNQSGDHRGLQIGLVNSAQKMRGLQIGLVNKARVFKGVQVGLWNTNKWRSMPLVNWGKR